jgi:dynein heavy chain
LEKNVATPLSFELRLSYESVYYNFNSHVVDALVQCTKGSLDHLRLRLGNHSTGSQFGKSLSAQKPFFKAELVLSIPNVVLQPRLEDIQGTLNKISTLIVDVSKKLAINWRVFIESCEERLVPRNPEDTTQVANNKDVTKVLLTLSSIVNFMKKDCEAHREQFGKYDFLWKDDKNETIQKFLDSSPSIADFEVEINRYESVEKEIAEIAASTQIGILLISSEPLKLALLSETKTWKQQYGLKLNQKVKADMEQLIEYMETKTVKLSRKISDIDDLRITVETLSEIREAEVDIDMKVSPIEEAYLLLAKHNVIVTKEETEMVDSLRYSWKKLKGLVLDVQAQLSTIQPVFRKDLLGAVEKFSFDVDEYTKDYNENGPMNQGIAPKTASERLVVYQRGFDELNRKLETYTGGEELFSIPVTPFPHLIKIKKELKLLQNLYGLYNDVLDKRNMVCRCLWLTLLV